MIIYKATSKTSGKSYIGQTRQALKNRQQGHFDDCNRRNNAFGSAIKKYGKNDFIWSVLEKCNSSEELNKKEIKYIKEYNTLAPNGYNLTTGGEGGFLRTEETKRKISISKKGKKLVHSATWKKGQRISIATEFKGKKVINLETGILYESIREAAYAHNIIKSTLAWQLRRKTTNQFAYAGDF